MFGLQIGQMGRSGGRLLFNPRRTFFSNNERGLWYDNADFATLFQDSAGTTPVTAVDQPVGLQLDKSKGLVLGPELVTNGGFDAGLTGWAPAGASIAAVDGRLAVTISALDTGAQTVVSTVIGKTYLATAIVNKGTATPPALGFSATGAMDNSTTSASGDQLIQQVFTATVTNQAVRIRTHSTAANYSGTFEIDNISVRELPGNHRLQSTAVDRPILRQDEGGRYYLEANGVNTWMQTNSIDFSSTDKMTVFAGVRKLSDAAVGIVFEHGVGGVDARAMSLNAPRGMSSSTFGLDIRDGVAPAATAQMFGFVAPVSAVLAALSDYSGATESRLRVNGGAFAGASTGITGSHGNHPLFFYRRAGTSLPFNGRDYGILIRGAASTDAQIQAMERWLAQRTGVVL